MNEYIVDWSKIGELRIRVIFFKNPIKSCDNFPPVVAGGGFYIWISEYIYFNIFPGTRDGNNGKSYFTANENYIQYINMNKINKETAITQ